MCYRIGTPKKEKLSEFLGSDFKVDDWNAYFHVQGHAMPAVPVIKQADHQRVVAMQWGVKPWWLDNPGEKAIFHNRTLNTMREYWKSDKPPHEYVKAQQRCLLFVDCFYEHHWVDEKGKTKQGYLIYQSDSSEWDPEKKKPFALAALQWLWVNESTGETHETASILTTKSNELLTHIHNNKKRMPVIMDRENYDLWLSEDLSHEDYRKLTAPYPDGILKAHKTKYNFAKRDAPTDSLEIQAPLVENEATGDLTLF